MCKSKESGPRSEIHLCFFYDFSLRCFVVFERVDCGKKDTVTGFQSSDALNKITPAVHYHPSA